MRLLILFLAYVLLSVGALIWTISNGLLPKEEYSLQLSILTLLALGLPLTWIWRYRALGIFWGATAGWVFCIVFMALLTSLTNNSKELLGYLALISFSFLVFGLMVQLRTDRRSKPKSAWGLLLMQSVVAFFYIIFLVFGLILFGTEQGVTLLDDALYELSPIRFK